jgi:acyl-CoA synthetase (AMP-forming)/AMP-acid ligase II
MMNHAQTLRHYAEWCDRADLRRGDRYLIVNPFFHIFGYKAGCIASLIRGATIVPVRVFQIDCVLELIERERITMLPGPPTLYHSLLSSQGERDLSSLRAGVTGAADIPVELVRRVRTELPFQTLMTGYGLTEAGTVTLSMPDDSFEDIATTAGLPCDGIEVGIAGDGEILVRGYNVMQGYLDDPAGTAEAIDDDGWLHPEISETWTGQAGCASSAAKKTCSSWADSMPIRPRSRGCCSITRPSRKRRLSVFPTSASGKWARHLSSGKVLLAQKN